MKRERQLMPLPDVLAVQARLRDYREATGATMFQLAVKIGMSHGWVQTFLVEPAPRVTAASLGKVRAFLSALRKPRKQGAAA